MVKINVKVEIDVDAEDDECCMFSSERKCRWLLYDSGRYERISTDMIMKCILFDNELRTNEDGYPLRCDDCWFRII